MTQAVQPPLFPSLMIAGHKGAEKFCSENLPCFLQTWTFQRNAPTTGLPVQHPVQREFHRAHFNSSWAAMAQASGSEGSDLKFHFLCVLLYGLELVVLQEDSKHSHFVELLWELAEELKSKPASHTGCQPPKLSKGQSVKVRWRGWLAFGVHVNQYHIYNIKRHVHTTY